MKLRLVHGTSGFVLFVRRILVPAARARFGALHEDVHLLANLTVGLMYRAVRSRGDFLFALLGDRWFGLDRWSAVARTRLLARTVVFG